MLVRRDSLLVLVFGSGFSLVQLQHRGNFVFSDSEPGLAGSESGEMLQYSGEEFEAVNYPFIQIGTSQ